MANINHQSLADPLLHEPKGVAAAASGTVYVADGTGSGAFQNIGNVGKKAYARAFIEDNVTTFAVAAAVDSTLHTAADYVAIPASVITAGIANDVTFDANDSFVINTAGVYEISGWASISTTGTNNVIGLAFMVNGIAQVVASPVPKTKLKVAGDIITAPGFGIFSLPAGVVIRPAVADDTGSTVTIHEGAFSVTFISAV